MVGRHPQTNRIRIPLWAVAVVFGYLVLVGLHEWIASSRQIEPVTTCMFRIVTGQPCPTCGTTRMVLALAHGEVLQAIRLNPFMFFLAVLSALWLLARSCGLWQLTLRTSRHARVIALAVVVGLFLGNWVYLIVHA